MNSICLSVAPNLRCQELNRVQHIVLIVPPALELVFSFTLAVTSASSLDGKKRWLLVFDGLSFFLLALTDFLAHVVPQAASTVHIFALLDTIIAAASFLPLLFYTFFLFLFARAGLVSLLPTRFSRLTTLLLLAAIPPTLIFNELGSLLGLTHTSFPSHNQGPILAVGFSTIDLQRISLFFSSATLALLTLFQAIIFIVSFVRLARGFLDERRIESAKHDLQAHEEIHLFRGLGWLAGGLKLGAIETVVGFANISFAVVVSRRVLRLFARGSLIIGIIKGLNVIDDFHTLEADLRAARSGPRLNRFSRRLSRFMISNPRSSTFQELSPNASSFHASQLAKREKRERVGPSPLALGNVSTFTGFNVAEFDDPEFDNTVLNVSRSGSKSNQRVTVHYNGKTPPVLQLRFSTLDMDVHPLPASLPNNHNLTGHSHGHPNAFQNPSLPVTVEHPLEDQVSLSGSGLDQQLFYIRPAPGLGSPPIPSRPLRDPRRVSHAAPGFTGDVPMQFQGKGRDSPRSSQTSPKSLSQDVPRPSQDTSRPSYDSPGGFRRSARTASAASDSLDAVREIAARFPGLPPRVIPGKTPSRTHDSANLTLGAGGAHSLPKALGDEADADSDTEWRTLARARSTQRRREVEAQQAQSGNVRSASQGGDDLAAGAITDISPVNSIKRKPAPSPDEAQADEALVDETGITEAIISRAALTARAARSGHGHDKVSSLDDPSSYYSDSDSNGDADDGEISYIEHNVDTPELTPGPGTPATTAAAISPGPGTPTWFAGRAMGIESKMPLGLGKDSNAYTNVQQAQSTSPQQSQPQSPPPRLPSLRDGSLEERRRGRLMLLRRELRASAHDSATANAALEPELQAPWLHTDPLTQLQTIGTGTLHMDEDEDAVLDEAWRRAGLTRIKSVSRVRVHTTPRVEHGSDVRGSLFAVEEEEEEDEGLRVPVSPGEMQEQERRSSLSVSLRKPARLDSGVLGEDDKKLVRQSIRI